MDRDLTRHFSLHRGRTGRGGGAHMRSIYSGSRANNSLKSCSVFVRDDLVTSSLPLSFHLSAHICIYVVTYFTFRVKDQGYPSKQQACFLPSPVDACGKKKKTTGERETKETRPVALVEILHYLPEYLHSRIGRTLRRACARLEHPRSQG